MALIKKKLAGRHGTKLGNGQCRQFFLQALKAMLETVHFGPRRSPAPATPSEREVRAERMVWFGDAERRHSVVHRRRQRSQRRSRFDAQPKDARRFRTGKETGASNVDFDGMAFDRLQRLF